MTTTIDQVYDMARDMRVIPLKRAARTVSKAGTLRVSAGQGELLNADEYIAGLIGGIGSGKTFILARYLRRKLRQEANTGTVGMIVANTYAQLSQATLPELWKAFEEINLRYGRDYVYNEIPPKHWRGVYNKFGKKCSNVLTIRPWNIQAITRSLDNYNAIRGVEVGFIGQDEATGATDEAFKVALGRCRCSKATKREVRIVSSPNGYDWLYDLLVDQPDNNPQLRAERRYIKTKTADNPTLDPAYIKTLYSIYDEQFAKQELEGEFVLLNQGHVYYTFDRKKHVKRFNPSRQLPWAICFDFNRTPYSVVLCQIVNRGGVEHVFAVDEVVMSNAATPEVCREIIRRITPYVTNQPVMVYGDPSGRAKHTNNNRSDYDIITQHFGDAFNQRFQRRWRSFAPPVVDRINAVNALLRNANGETRLYVSERCTTLRKDFERVQWKEGSKQIDKTTDKMLTHASDAIGYMVQERYPVRPLTSGRLRL